MWLSQSSWRWTKSSTAPAPHHQFTISKQTYHSGRCWRGSNCCMPKDRCGAPLPEGSYCSFWMVVDGCEYCGGGDAKGSFPCAAWVGRPWLLPCLSFRVSAAHKPLVGNGSGGRRLRRRTSQDSAGARGFNSYIYLTCLLHSHHQQVQPHQDRQDQLPGHHEHAGPGQALQGALPHHQHQRGLR